jgi:hypothetical protein
VINSFTDSVFSYATIPTSLHGVPMFCVTSQATTIGMVYTPEPGYKRSITWIGRGVGIDELYVNVYKVSKRTGALTAVALSANIADQVNDTFSWQYLAFGRNFDNTAGAWYAVEMSVPNNGTYEIVGKCNKGIPTFPRYHPSKLGATRSFVGDTMTYSDLVPWFSLEGGRYRLQATAVILEDGPWHNAAV